ncbi:MAG: cysteine desulfurase [Flavobacteriales bacterium]|nr:cysteine desulfurase [Flavobacteriales bacterium]
MNRIYLDNASSTPMYEEVIQEMTSVMKDTYGNPSSTHSFGQKNKSIIENSRKKIASLLHCSSNEVIFTSCATESNNLILRSCVYDLKVERIITTQLEHKSVLETIYDLQQKLPELEILFLPVDSRGTINLNVLQKELQLSSKKTLVSLMHGNNEFGNLIDLMKVGELCHENKALFHSDAVQTIGHLPINFGEIPIDFMCASAHKFHGPKGIGIALIKSKHHLKSTITGGGQENNHRSGTENVYAIAGMARALELSIQNLDENRRKVEQLKKYAIDQLEESIPNVQFTAQSSDLSNSLYTILNILLPFKNNMLSFQLDMKGISISQGSACNSGAVKLSNAIKNIVPKSEQNKITPLRISFSSFNTTKDVDSLVFALVELMV